MPYVKYLLDFWVMTNMICIILLNNKFPYFFFGGGGGGECDFNYFKAPQQVSPKNFMLYLAKNNSY